MLGGDTPVEDNRGVGGRRLDHAKLKAQTTYNAAAEFFDDNALGFWAHGLPLPAPGRGSVPERRCRRISWRGNLADAG
jgi:hypothetical protein